MKEVKQAVKLKPMEYWRDWSHNSWNEHFELLACMMERQANGLLKLDKRNGVSCDLMVALSSAWSQEKPNKAAALVNEKAVPAYDDDLIEGNKQAILLMAGRGEIAKSRGYPYIYLIVPNKTGFALPGAPEVYLAVKYAKDDMNLEYSIVNDPLSDKVKFNSNISASKKDEFRAYITKHKSHVTGFISIGLSFDGNPVGVINVDCKNEARFDTLAEKAVISLLTPYCDDLTPQN